MGTGLVLAARLGDNWTLDEMRQSEQSDRARVSSEEAVAETFDRWVTDGMAAGMERRHRRLAERMLDRVAISTDGCLLDVGCGIGWLARLIVDRVPEAAVVGIDVSREMVHQARLDCADLANVMFAPGAAEEIPWAEEYFTHVMSIESAYYWRDPAKAALEIFRVSKPGGTFHILINYYEENRFSAGWDTETGLTLHRLSAADWVALFATAGFEDVISDQIPDDSPISPGKSPEAKTRRQGLQDIGALYVTGRRSKAKGSADLQARVDPGLFRILR